MSKSEQLIEYLLQDVVAILMNEQHVSWQEAMQKFYESQTFEKLSDVETGLYLESASYIYEMFVDEQREHVLSQN